MWLLVWVLLLADVRPVIVIEDHCALIEKNDVFDEDFKEKRFTQLIFWDMRRKRNQITEETYYGYWIGDWRIISGANIHYSHTRREWVAMFFDKKDSRMRLVTSASYRHTKANFDLEVQARKHLPVSLRTPVLAPAP